MPTRQPTIKTSTYIFTRTYHHVEHRSRIFVPPAKPSTTSDVTVHARVRVQKRQVPRFLASPSAGAYVRKRMSQRRVHAIFLPADPRDLQAHKTRG